MAQTSTVSIGNLPYDVTETQLTDIFSEVGKVEQLKLMFNRDTGKPLGRGFCRYADASTAASAVRNLNGHTIGNRMIRVQLKTGGADDGDQGRTHASAAAPTSSLAMAEQAIAQAPSVQLMNLLSQMRHYAKHDTPYARALLTQNPQLVHALAQSMVALRLVDSDVIQRARGPDPRASAYPMQPPMAPAAGMVGMGSVPVPPGLPAGYPSYPGYGMPGYGPGPPPGPPGAAHMPAPAPYGLRPPPPPGTRPAPGFDAAGLPDEQRRILMQVMQLTPEQIAMLPAHEQEQVRALRMQMMGAPR